MAAVPASVEQWRLGRLLGTGSFASVYAASQPDGRVAAVKVIDAFKLTPKLRESLDSEVAVMRRASSPHIVALLEQHQARRFTLLGTTQWTTHSHTTCSHSRTASDALTSLVACRHTGSCSWCSSTATLATWRGI